VQQEDLNSAPRYTLHSLVRAFAGARLREQSAYEQAARERWVQWYVQLTAQVGYCWQDLDRLKLLDPEYETIPTILDWASRSQLMAEALHIAQNCSYYYYVRGLWNTRPHIHNVAAEAARRLNQPFIEAEEIAIHAEWCVRKGHFTDMELYLPKLREIVTITDAPVDTYYRAQHALALYLFCQGRIEQAQAIWRETLERAPDLLPHHRISLQNWLALCLVRKGFLVEARQAHLDALHEAMQHQHMRLIISIQVDLAAIDLAQGHLESAEHVLADVFAKVQQYQDRRKLPDIQRLYACLHTLRGDLPAAHAALAEAIDRFERLGMRRELAEGRAALADLEARERAEVTG